MLSTEARHAGASNSSSACSGAQIGPTVRASWRSDGSGTSKLTTSWGSSRHASTKQALIASWAVSLPLSARMTCQLWPSRVTLRQRQSAERAMGAAGNARNKAKAVCWSSLGGTCSSTMSKSSGGSIAGCVCARTHSLISARLGQGRAHDLGDGRRTFGVIARQRPSEARRRGRAA